MSKNKKETFARVFAFSVIALLVYAFIFTSLIPTASAVGGLNPSAPGAPPSTFQEGCERELPDGTAEEIENCVNSKIDNAKGDDDIRWYHRLGSYIGYVVLTIAALFTHVGGTMLDMAVRDVVLGMGTEIKSGGAFNVENSINNAWTVIRDFCNLAFIFGFVWIGIQTILKGFDGAGVKKNLSALIIAALLINFSLFFSQVVIDVSNVLAVEIHDTLSIDKGVTSENKNIAEHFMNQMGLLTLWDTESEKLASVDAVGSPAFFIMGAVFLMIAAFVFAAGAILLVIRFVVLIFLMIFSPILFAAMVFEGTRQYSTKLWKILLNQAFFAPVYLLMLLISFRIVVGLTGETAGEQDFVKALKDGEQVETILNFTIITMFLILSLIAAKSASAVGASRAVAIGGNLRRSAQGYAGRTLGGGTFGMAAAAGRSTLGRRGRRLANDQNLKDRAARGGVRGWASKQRLTLADKASRAGFDARNVAGVGKKVGLGEGQKGGYEARVKAKEKKEKEFAKLLGQVPDDDARVMAQQSEVDKTEEQIREARANRDATDDPGKKKDFANKIAELQKELQKKKDAVEQEKNRRIIGSSFDTDAVQKIVREQDERVKNAEETIRDEVKKYREASDEERGGIEKKIEEAQKEIKDARAERQKARKKAKISMGYAGMVENALYMGTSNRQINKIIAEKLRKEYSKKIKGDPEKGETGDKSESV